MCLNQLPDDYEVYRIISFATLSSRNSHVLFPHLNLSSFKPIGNIKPHKKTVKSSGIFKDKVIVFSGFRNQIWKDIAVYNVALRDTTGVIQDEINLFAGVEVGVGIE